MKNDNLPPGVTASMIPGNEVDPMDKLFEQVTKDLEMYGINPEEFFVIWKMGLAARNARLWVEGKHPIQLKSAVKSIDRAQRAALGGFIEQ